MEKIVNKICEEIKESEKCEWYQSLQTKLKNTKESTFEEIFKECAKKLMSAYVLKIGDEEFELCELEFYHFSENHKDFYTHLHCLQLEAGKFYVHETGLNRAGIDLTFGNGKYFGGILIRALKTSKGFIYGSAKSQEVIKNAIGLKIESYPELQERLNNNALKICCKKLEEDCIYISTRVGLNESVCDNEAIFRSSFYRFVRKDLFENSTKKPKEETKPILLKEKTKLIVINNINGQRENQKSFLSDLKGSEDKYKQNICKKIKLENCGE